MTYIGFRIELAQRIVRPDFKRIVKKYNSSNKFKIYDLYTNGKIIIRKKDSMIFAGGEENKQDNKNNKRMNFSVLLPIEDNKIERIVQIINVLGNGRLIRERIKIFVDGESVLNNLPELMEFKQIFRDIEADMPGFILNGWYYAPDAVFDE